MINRHVLALFFGFFDHILPFFCRFLPFFVVNFCHFLPLFELISIGVWMFLPIHKKKVCLLCVFKAMQCNR